MNAYIIIDGKEQRFEEWESLIEYLSLYEDRKEIHMLNISIYFAGTFWQQILYSDPSNLLQFVYIFKEAEYKLSKMHQKYLALLLKIG